MKKIITLIAVCASGIMSAQSQLQSMIACYPLACDHAQNYSNLGPALNGNVNNISCTTGRWGVPASASSFLGNSSSFIQLPNSPGLLQAPQVCVSGWFNLNNTNTSQYLIFAKNNCLNFFEAFSLTYSSGQFYVIKNGGPNISNLCLPLFPTGAWVTSNQIVTAPTMPIIAGQWYHIVFYIDHQKMWLYVNNQLRGTANNFGAIDYDFSSSVILGGTNNAIAMQGPVNAPYNGLMEDVRFFSQELTSWDIDALYTMHLGCGESQKPTGIDALSSTPINLKLFPNPSQGKFILESESELNFTVTDISGKMVAHTISKIEAHQSEISLNESKAGLYFVSIYNQKGEIIRTEKMAVME